MRQLAEAVGVQKSSIYAHYSSKEAIFRSLFDQWGPAAFVDRLKSQEYRRLTNDPRAFCHRCADDLIERWMDWREQLFVAVASRERGNIGEDRARFHEILFVEENDLLAEYFEAFQNQQLIRVSDTREVARIFSSGLINLRMTYVDAPEGPASREILQQAMSRYLDCFLALILKPTC